MENGGRRVEFQSKTTPDQRIRSTAGDLIGGWVSSFKAAAGFRSEEEGGRSRKT